MIIKKPGRKIPGRAYEVKWVFIQDFLNQNYLISIIFLVMDVAPVSSL